MADFFVTPPSRMRTAMSRQQALKSSHFLASKTISNIFRSPYARRLEALNLYFANIILVPRTMAKQVQGSASA